MKELACNRILLLLGAVALSTFMTPSRISASSPDQASHKVLVCHIPPGNPANMHTISIDQSGVPAHLAHGDYIGTCGSGPQI